MADRTFNLDKNYIYLYHTDTWIFLPSYPEQIQDNLSSSFSSTNILARTAPIFSYSNSGPRTVQVQLNLHRDMMSQINWESNATIELGDDYVDTLIKQIQAIALPKYIATQKLVDPPMVAVRFGDEVFIKGIVNGGVSITSHLPLLENNKYALVDIGFQVTEVDPYDADSVMTHGQFRGFSKTLERTLPYKSGNYSL